MFKSRVLLPWLSSLLQRSRSWHVDYSRGVRLSRRRIALHGRPCDLHRMLSSEKWSPLFSDEEPVRRVDYQKIVMRFNCLFFSCLKGHCVPSWNRPVQIAATIHR